MPVHLCPFCFSQSKLLRELLLRYSCQAILSLLELLRLVWWPKIMYVYINVKKEKNPLLIVITYKMLMQLARYKKRASMKTKY